MPTHKTLNGILLIVDLVDYTRQASALDDRYTAKFDQYFKDKINAAAAKRGFGVVKFMGDAALLFGPAEPENLLELMLDLFQRDKPEDCHGFDCRLRMVAHQSYFQFEMEKKRPVDLVSAEGIKVFRLEKYASAWELAVTDGLFQGLKPLLTERNIQGRELDIKEPLKGFGEGPWYPPFYRLTVMPEKAGAANLLQTKLEELEQSVRRIPVFGNLYPPVPMENNFINLSLHRDQGVPAGYRPPARKKPGAREKERLLLKIREREPGRERDRDPRDDWMFEKEYAPPEREPYQCFTARELYKQKSIKKALLFGLPGAGKTTILRHLAHAEFKANRRRKGAGRMVLYVPCRDIPSYGHWYRWRRGGNPVFEVQPALEYFTWVFLFGGRDWDTPDDGKGAYFSLSPDERVEYQNAHKQVCSAYKEKRLTLLVDALDEAPDGESKKNIQRLFQCLGDRNRLFLTARPAEEELFPRGKRKEWVFKVMSLTMEQVRGVAANVLPPGSEVYRRFDEAVWREELVVRMAATPITALLVTAYFQAHGEFHNRYPMYDLLMRFVLLKVWEQLKTGEFPYQSMEVFFREVGRGGFFDRHPEAGVIYRGLAELCFDLFYRGEGGKVHRSMTKETLTGGLSRHLARHHGYDGRRLTGFVDQWLERLLEDHLLVRSGSRRYVFVHATVMEYLAAFHMCRQAIRDPEVLMGLLGETAARREYMVLETLPIALGSSVIFGLKALDRLQKLETEVPAEEIFQLGVKGLAELEWLVYKSLAVLQIEPLKREILDLLDRFSSAHRWVYKGLAERVLSKDKKELEGNLETFARAFKLSRNVLLEEYISYDDFSRCPWEIQQLREQLLRLLVHEEILSRWFKHYRFIPKEYDNLLRLDTSTYHPEDKNFNYYSQIIGPELTGIFGSPNLSHSGQVDKCIFSSDGNRILMISDKNRLVLWEATTGKEIRTFTGDGDYILDCDISSDGSRIVSVSEYGILTLWDVVTSKKIRTFRKSHSMYSCHLSANADRLLWGAEDNLLQLWDTATGTSIFTIHESGSYPISYSTLSADGNLIISALKNGAIKLYDEGASTVRYCLNGHEGEVIDCTFSADNKFFASASSDHTIKLWDTSTGNRLLTFPAQDARGCVLSADGGYLLGNLGAETSRLWDTTTGEEIRTFTSSKYGHMRRNTLSPDGSRVLDASGSSTLKLWDVVSGEKSSIFAGHRSRLLSCSTSADGSRLLSASADGVLKLWETGSGKELCSIVAHHELILDCDISADGNLLLSASDADTMKLWEAETGKELHRFKPQGAWRCSFSADGSLLVSTSINGMIELWDALSLNKINTFSTHEGRVWQSALSFNGSRLITASEDDSLKLWHTATGKEIHSFKIHEEGSSACAISVDASLILAASIDRTLKLWDAVTGKEIRTFTGHNAMILDCIFSEDSSRIFSVSHDRTLKMWDTETGKTLETLPLPWIARKVVAAPDGRVFTANLNGTLSVFEFK